MENRLKKMGESASWKLLIRAAQKGAENAGYTMKRLPGRGLSNTWDVTKDGKTQKACIRTTRDRWMAFPPLKGGRTWKTLSDMDLVLCAAVDDRENPQNVDVYLFPADEVRKRFDASYAARADDGQVLRDGYGMWVMLDKGDDQVPSKVGHGLAVDYPAIDRFTIDELESELGSASNTEVSEPEAEVLAREEAPTPLATVAEVLSFARQRIAELTGMPMETIKLDLKMGV